MTHERGIPLEKGSALLRASVAAFLVDVLGPAVGGGVDWIDLDWNYKAPSAGPPCWFGIEHDVRWRFLSSRTPYIGSSGRFTAIAELGKAPGTPLSFGRFFCILAQFSFW